MAKALAVPTHQGVGLEDMQCLKTPRPYTVQQDPEQAFAPMEPEPFVISLGDHGQLLTQPENFHMEQGAASEEAGQRGEQGEYDSFHPMDANARG